MLLQKKIIILSISLIIILISLSCFTSIVFISTNVLAQLPASSANETYQLVKKWGSNGADNGQFRHPEGLGIDSSNNVYVADAINDRIQKFDSSGKFITEWGSSGTEDGQFRSPTDIAIDSSGNVYITDTFNDRIQVFAPDIPITPSNSKDNVDGNDVSSIPNNTDSSRSKESVPQSPAGITDQV